MFSSKPPDEALRFEVLVSDRIYHLAALTEHEKHAWIVALSEASGIKPTDFRFAGYFQGWLWRLNKGALFTQEYVVLSGQPSESVRLLMFDEDSCIDCPEGTREIFIQSSSKIVLQDYGKSVVGAAHYLNFRFELTSESTKTVVFAADSEVERTRWLNELKRLGLGMNDKRPSVQQWDYQGALETRLAITTLGWKSRYIRLRGHEFIVFREQSSQVVKEIVSVPAFSPLQIIISKPSLCPVYELLFRVLISRRLTCGV